jgi:hypothetical protein
VRKQAIVLTDEIVPPPALVRASMRCPQSSALKVNAPAAASLNFYREHP